MKNDKITPVTFSDESVDLNSVNRVAPGSGSGSGSGSGGSTLGADSGDRTITSKRYGCSWNVKCQFTWNASWDPGFTNIRLSFSSMNLVGTGDTVGIYTAKGFSDTIYDLQPVHTITWADIVDDRFEVPIEFNYLLNLTVFKKITGNDGRLGIENLGEIWKLNNVTIKYKISTSSFSPEIIFDSCDIDITPED